MAGNPFDQFDVASAPEPGSAAEGRAIMERSGDPRFAVGNPFDQFDPAKGGHAGGEGIGTGLHYGSQGVNRGIADTFGIPGNLYNAALRALGMPGDLPIGSDAIASGINYGVKKAKEFTGLGNPDVPASYKDINEVPQTYRPAARAGEVAGSLPAMALPFLGAARGVGAAEIAAMRAKEGSAIGNAGRQIVASAAESPGAFMASQIPASLGQGAGAYAAEAVAPGSQIAQTIGQLGGGLTGAALQAGGSAAAQAGGGLINRMTAPLTTRTEEGLKTSAARALQPIMKQSGELPEDIIAKLRQPSVAAGQTAGGQADSQAITGVTNYLGGSNPALANAVRSGEQAYGQNLQRGFQGAFEPGDPRALTAVAADRQRNFASLIDNLVSRAAEKAGVTAGPVQPNSPGVRTELNTRLYKEMDAAVGQARKTENILWGRIDKAPDLPPVHATEAVADLRAGMLPDQKFPELIEKTLTRFGMNPPGADTVIGQKGGYTFTVPAGKPTTPTVGDMLTLRSELLGQARSLRGGATPDFNGARRMDKIADGILKDLHTVNDPNVAIARDYSSALNDRLTRSAVGDVLGTRASGADRVPPELSLDRITAGSPEAVALKLGELQTGAVPLRVTAAEAPTMMDAAKRTQQIQEQYLRSMSDKIINSASETGAVKPKAVDKFLLDNAAILDRFPQYRQQLIAARDAQMAHDQVQKQAAEATKQAAQNAAFSKVLNAGENPADAISTVLSGPNPVRDMRRLTSLARKGGEESTSGLRGALMNYVQEKAGTSFAKANEVLRAPMIPGGPTLLNSMRDNAILTATQHAALTQHLDAGIANEAAKLSGIAVNQFGSEPGMWGKAAARIFGAKLASATGAGSGGAGTSLQAAQLGANLAEKSFARLPADRLKIYMSKVLASDNPADLIDILERASTESIAKTSMRKQTSQAFVLLRAAIPRTQSESDRQHDLQPGELPLQVRARLQ